jgi:RNA polymerase sigma-54 factor
LEANPALDEGDEDQAETEDQESYATQDSDTENGEEKDELANKEEEFELDDYINEYLEEDPSSYKLQANNYSQDEEEKTIAVAVEDTFHEYLEAQVGLMDFADDKEEKIAHQIVGSIDDDGYLRRDPIAIIDDLMFAHNINATPDEVENMLKRVQKLDPPGVGARDLRECLLIQIQSKIEAFTKKGEHPVQAFYDAEEILDQHFNEFSKKHYQKLQRHIGSSEAELREAYDEILKLNPKPASGHVGQNNKGIHYIVPDFIIENRDGELDLTLNSRNAPDLRINDQYTDMLKSYKASTSNRKGTKTEKEAVMFIKQKIDSAKWFIDAIKQRQQTMYKSMYAIMQYQYDFFLSGDQKKLRPMILKDIADITGLDISTVSRVANSKFVQTEFGTKRLKDFFSESLQTSTGEEVSTLEVKKILTEIISGENKRKPLSDEKLKNMLQDKSYNIARRTVAKYREQLNIPVARLRKVL